MSIAVMNWVWASSPTSGNERLVLLALADACSRDDGSGCWPGEPPGNRRRARARPAARRGCRPRQRRGWGVLRRFGGCLAVDRGTAGQAGACRSGRARHGLGAAATGLGRWSEHGRRAEPLRRAGRQAVCCRTAATGAADATALVRGVRSGHADAEPSRRRAAPLPTVQTTAVAAQWSAACPPLPNTGVVLPGTCIGHDPVWRARHSMEAAWRKRPGPIARESAWPNARRARDELRMGFVRGPGSLMYPSEPRWVGSRPFRELKQARDAR